MDVKALSASRIKLWQTCKYQYGCRYHKFHPEVEIDRPVYFGVGTAVHSALEFAGNLVIENKLKEFSEADIAEITKAYFKAAAKETIDDAVALDDGLSLVLHKLYTFEFAYEIVSLEKWFNVEIEGVPVVGAMDRLVKKTPKNLCVIDYKTSRTALTDDELAADVQVGIYDIVARMQHPEYSRYTVCLDYLRLFPKQVMIPKRKRNALKLQLVAVYDDIIKATKVDLKPSIHQFCPWCPYVTVCPAIKEVEEELKDLDPKQVAQARREDVADLYVKSKLLEKIYQDLKKKAYSRLVEFIRKDDLNKTDNRGKKAIAYECGDYIVSMRQNAYVSYNIDKAYRMLGADRLIKCVDLNRMRFEKEAKLSGISPEDLDKIRNVNFSKPIVDVKPKKTK